MSAHMIEPMDEAPAAPERSPSRRVALTTLSVALVPSVWWTVGVMVVVSAVTTFGLSRFDVLGQGAWTGFASVLRYMAGVTGILIASGMRPVVINGITRRDALRGLTVGLLGLSAVTGLIVALGGALEALIFAGDDQVSTPVGSLAAVGVTWVAATTQLVAYLASGAVIGLAFNTLPWGPAIVAIVPALVPAALTEALWAAALADIDPSSGPFQSLARGVLEPGAPAGIAAVVASVVTVAIAYAVLERLVVRLAFPR